MHPAIRFVVGLVALVGGGDLLVRGASRLAVSLGLSPLVVGLTVVAFGTSAPELAVSVKSAWSGQVDIALGNVVGSNIFNVLVILGLAALITPLAVQRRLVRQEVPLMIGASLLLLLLALDRSITRIDGVILSLLLVAYVAFLVWQSRREAREREAAVESAAAAPEQGWRSRRSAQLALIAAGLVLLVLGSDWLVDAAVAAARALGVSELVIGLTIVAGGTSLPEVATSVIAGIKGEREIAVGNVVGSNIFNILCVLGLSAVVAPSALPVVPVALQFDLPVMIAVAVACLPVFFTGHQVSRWEGAVFLLFYAAYITFIVLDAQGHPLLPHIRCAVLVFALPLTLLTVGVVVARELRRRSAR